MEENWNINLQKKQSEQFYSVCNGLSEPIYNSIADTFRQSYT